MAILGLLAGISLVLGIFLMLGKKQLNAFEDALNKMIVRTERMAYKYNKALGMLLILLAAVLIYISIFAKN